MDVWQTRVNKNAQASDGVTEASQRRYVHYMQEVMEWGGYRANRLVLSRLIMHTCPVLNQSKDGCHPWFLVEENRREMYRSGEKGGHEFMSSSQEQRVFDGMEILVTGDIRITMYDHDEATNKDSLLCYFWFHTGFIEQATTTITKKHIDMAWSDTKCKTFKANFSIELEFVDTPHPVSDSSPGHVILATGSPALQSFLLGAASKNLLDATEEGQLKSTYSPATTPGTCVRARMHSQGSVQT